MSTHAEGRFDADHAALKAREVPGEREATDGFRAGFVAILGLPNVGKSTLLNALVGVRLSIVTPKAQTTRRRLLGIYSDSGHQAIFIDTPGLLEPRYLLQEAMRIEAWKALEDADVLVHVVDVGFPPSIEAARNFERPAGLPALLCLNKADRLEEPRLSALQEEFAADGWAALHPTVATRGEGVQALRRSVLLHLPPSPPLYPTDDLATAPLRYFAAEFVRETCFELLSEEVPYAVEVGVEEFREPEEEGKPTFISARIYVERSSQKGIVIGSGGRMIRAIGTEARQKLEEFLGRPVYLELRVKVLANWRKRRSALKLLGFHAPPE